MPSFVVMVPNGGDGEHLGEYEADYLPRVGDKFLLFHPMLTGSSDEPFEGEVAAVYWQAFFKDHKYATDTAKNVAEATVWLAEYGGAPKLWCDCTPEERQRWKLDERGLCENCGHER
jgi:hypothetical protein